MIVITGDGKLFKNLDKAGVIDTLKKAQAAGDRFASITGAYAEGLDPHAIEKEAGYKGATEKEVIKALYDGSRKMDKTVNYQLRDIPAQIWAAYQGIAKANGSNAAEELRKHIMQIVNNY